MQELTQVEIEEGNALIGAFTKQLFLTDDDEEFHRSYDWIMPILKEIEERGNIVEINMSLVVICRICALNGTNGKYFNIIHDNNGGLSPITPLFRAAVEYVKWRNSNIN